MKSVLAAIMLASLAGAASAAEVIDQSNTNIDTELGFLGIGGEPYQKLAQTFTVGMDGDLVALNLPILGCGGGDLVIRIVDLDAAGAPDDGAILGVTRISPHEAPASYEGLYEFRLDSSVPLSAGDRVAFTLVMEPDAPTSNCSYAESPAGDLYAGGGHYFEARPNPPGWLNNEEFADENYDLAFQSVMETGGGPPPMASGDCLLNPSGSLPIPSWTPVCRCLRDPGLREFRCAFLHPDFFAVWRTPLPLPPVGPYVEQWEVLPLTDLGDLVRVNLSGAGLEKPVDLTFAGKSRKAVETREVKIMAPGKPADISGAGLLSYGQEVWKLDRSLAKEDFGDGKPVELRQMPGRKDKQ
ncbi:MAG: hypothetical protein R3C51_11865 [Parvularculaceae bacterium]